ncbi:MAG: alpha/beta hydrolase [Candidatus Eremiobacteraeota bacterium]|nr:alpha/beta hydrolase [Candidatus Eremiobacteraeota bacterium]MBC5827711.1 alpha/beta hydrolase [Candidatus Eremiobacteraeota bacterium]
MKILLQLSTLLAAAALVAPAYADTPSTSFDINSIHVDKYGAGAQPSSTSSQPALILIPGLTNSAAVWGPTIHRYAGTYTVYALTLAGFGGRSPAARPRLDAADADIVALIQKEHIDKPVLIGHSMGGHLALRLAAEHSPLLRGAIAVDGLPVFPGLENMTPDQRSAAASKMVAQIKSASTPEQFMQAERTYVVPNLTLAKNVDTVTQFSKGADLNATADYMRELVTTDERPQLTQVTIPVLEIAPYDPTLENESFANAAAKQVYYQGLLKNDKTVTVKMVQGSRHFIMWDQPDAFYADVDAFLATLK